MKVHAMFNGVTRKILSFAWPILLTNMTLFMSMMVNRIWAGKFLGTDAIAAISLANTILYVLISIGIGMMSAVSSIIAIEFGANNKAQLGLILNNSFIIVLVVAAIISVGVITNTGFLLNLMDTPLAIRVITKNYLWISASGFPFLFLQMLISYVFRSISNNKIANNIIFWSVIVNMLLDPLLMLGIGPFPKLGVNGAAFAGLAAQLTSCIYAFFKVLQQRNNLYLNSTTFKLDWGIIKQINKRGFFNILQVVIINLGLLVTQYYVNIFGSNSIAIFGAVMIIIDGLLYFTWSVALAVSILAGQAFGAKNQQELVKILLSGCYIVLVPVTIVSIVSLIATKYIFVIFFNVANNFSLLHECTFAIKVMAIAYPCLALNVLINAFLNGVGSNRIVTIIMTISTLFLRIPLLYILGLHFSINGVWFALCITYVLSCGFTCLYLWMKKHNYLNVVI